jgi:Mg2+ and Co2+ transporter CorA
MQPIDATFWRDITSPNQAYLEALAINDLVIDDILHGGQRTKIERYADGVFFVFYAFSFETRDGLELIPTPI